MDRDVVSRKAGWLSGDYPLVHATGAGAASRRAPGTAVFGGMIAATVLAVFFVPILYVVMERLGELRRRPKLPERATARVSMSEHLVAAGRSD